MSFNTLFGNVPSDWAVSTIGDIATLQQGLQISKELRINAPKDGYMPLLKITDLPARIFAEFVTDIKPQHIASEEDIIYTRTGQVGLVYTDIKGCVHNNCFKVNVDYSQFNKKYIYYYLKSDKVYEYSNQVASGSVQKDLKHSAFKSCLIGYPKIFEQKAIADTLSCLDSKIELNNRINKTLEEMAQAIFKSWFVDFEPFQDGDFEDSELGRIPKGWKVGCIDEISKQKVDVCRRADIPKESIYIGLEHIPRKKMIINGFGRIEDVTSNKLHFDKFNILFGKIRPYFHKVSIAPWDGYCSTDAIVLAPNKDDYYSYIVLMVFSDSFVQHAVQISQGTKMPRAEWKVLKNFKIVIPPDKIMESFNKIIMPFINEMLLTNDQNNTLTQIRDNLIPKLMSGEIRVPIEEVK